MSWDPDQQLHCQSCRKLYKRVEVIQSLVQQLIIEFQQASSGSHPNSAFADDDDDDNDDDEGDTETDNDGGDNRDNVDDEPSPHNVDGSDSATISCPHPACKNKPPYSQRNNLQRHYANHVECNETCVFCGHRSILVRNYVTHFEKCKARKNCKDSSGDKGRAATTKKRILSRVAANELDKMSKSGPKMGEMEFDSKRNGRKRKSGAAVSSSRRRRTSTEDAPTSNPPATVTLDSHLTLAGTAANTTESMPYSFNELPQLNRHNDYFSVRNGEFPTTLVTNNEFLGQSLLRGSLLSSRTMDWSQPYFTEPHYGTGAGGQTTLLYSQCTANPFTEIVAADVDGVDQSSIKDSNTGLVALYGAARALVVCLLPLYILSSSCYNNFALESRKSKLSKPKTSKKKKGLSIETLAAIVVLVIIVVIIICIALFILWRRQQKKKKAAAVTAGGY